MIIINRYPINKVIDISIRWLIIISFIALSVLVAAAFEIISTKEDLISKDKLSKILKVTTLLVVGLFLFATVINFRFYKLFNYQILIYTGSSPKEEERSVFIKENIFEKITLEEIEKIIKDKESGNLYIERKSCQFCKEFKPKLEQYLFRKNLKYLYYSTDVNRIDKKDYLEEQLKILGVNKVPAIVIIENGQVTKLFQGNETVEHLDELSN